MIALIAVVNYGKATAGLLFSEFSGFPEAQLVKNLPAVQETRVGFRVGEIRWRRDRPLTPVFWPKDFHGLYSPRGGKESDTTE